MHRISRERCGKKSFKNMMKVKIDNLKSSKMVKMWCHGWLCITSPALLQSNSQPKLETSLTLPDLVDCLFETLRVLMMRWNKYCSRSRNQHYSFMCVCSLLFHLHFDTLFLFFFFSLTSSSSSRVLWQNRVSTVIHFRPPLPGDTAPVKMRPLPVLVP